MHGDFVPLKLMEEYVAGINGESKMRYLANHRRDIPPIGYFDNGEIRLIGNIHHAMVEPITYANRTTASWDNSLIIEEPITPIKLISRNDEQVSNFRISVDKNNFNKFEDLDIVGEELKSIYGEEVSLSLDTRKSLLPDPRIVITIAKYWLILYPLLKPFLSKIGEKLAEDISDDVYKYCKSNFKSIVHKLTESVKISRLKMVPKDKVLTTIFEIPGSPYIELHIKSDDATKIEKGLKTQNLLRVHKKISDLKKILDISEIYFILNAKDKWDFSYLITEDGKVVGTQSSFKKRDKLVTRINLSPTKAFSIGAEGVKYSLQRKPTEERQQ